MPYQTGYSSKDWLHQQKFHEAHVCISVLNIWDGIIMTWAAVVCIQHGFACHRRGGGAGRYKTWDDLTWAWLLSIRIGKVCWEYCNMNRDNEDI
jgi:hypothetical protein